MGYLKKHFFVFIVVLLLPFSVKAADYYPNWSIKGFGSIGFARSDTDKIGFFRNRTQNQETKKSLDISTDSRLGLQLAVELTDSLYASTQFIIREHSGDFFEQNFEWAYLRWHLNEDMVVRAGRIGFDVFLLSEYRNVSFAYPWMRPPHEFYANIPLTHFDGLDFKKTFLLDEGVLSVKTYAGYSSTTLSEEYKSASFEGPLAGINILYENGNWRSRAGYVFIRQVKDADFKELISAINDPVVNSVIPNINQVSSLLTFKNTNLHFMSLGVEYDDSIWLLHSEASYIESETIFNPDVASAYLSVGRRFGSVLIYSLYGVSQSFHKTTKISEPRFPDPELIALRQIVNGVVNRNGTDEQSLSLGVSWRFHPKVALKAQWSHFWLSDDGVALWQQQAQNLGLPENVNLLSFGFDFIF